MLVSSLTDVQKKQVCHEAVLILKSCDFTIEVRFFGGS